MKKYYIMKQLLILVKWVCSCFYAINIEKFMKGDMKNVDDAYRYFHFSVFIVGMVEMMVAGIMNLMSHDLHVSEAVIGQLVTLYALTFAICGPILVKVTQRLKLNRYYFGH